MLLHRLATTYSALFLPLFVIPVSCATSVTRATFTYTVSGSVYSLALPPNSSLAPESTADSRSVSATPLIATTAPNVPDATSQGVLVVPIVLDGTTYINSIPISEVNPIVVPSSAALVVATAVTEASSVSAFPLGPGLISVSSSSRNPTSDIVPSGSTTAIARSSEQSLTSAASSPIETGIISTNTDVSSTQLQSSGSTIIGSTASISSLSESVSSLAAPVTSEASTSFSVGSEPTSSLEPGQSTQSSLSSTIIATASASSASPTGPSTTTANTASETSSSQTSLPSTSPSSQAHSSTTSVSATRGILSTLSSAAGAATSSPGSSQSQAGPAPQNTDAPPSNGDSGAIHIHGEPGGSYACWALAAAIAAAWSLA